ncbi:MAG: MATE family efflux transporter [Marinagarivorans sp.]|nr:MATE family efflux transporter [Marinagarivorans sp.]
MALLSRTLVEWRGLARVGGPILIAQLAQMANGFVDTLMAGNASAADLAGVSIGVSLWTPLLLFFVGLLGALQPTISNHMGAKNTQAILPIAWQGLYVAMAGCVLMIALLWSAIALLGLLNPDADTARVAEGYIKAFLWGVPALLLLTALRGFTDGTGHTWVFMAFCLLSTLCNIPLNYSFIYGISVDGYVLLPAMGGIGCGWATTLANSIALLAFLIYLHWGKHFARLRLFAHRYRLNWPQLSELLRLGLPIGITLFIEVSMFCAIALFLVPLGAQTVAAHQIVLNAVSITFMVPLSLGMAVLLRVSFLVGEMQLQRARLVALSSLVLALMIACINVPLFLFGRFAIANLYSNDAVVIAIASHLFVLAAIFQIVDVVQVTAVNALRGYKDTAIPMWIVLLAFWAICLPLGYTLTFTTHLTLTPLGAAGFWWALIAALAVAATLLAWRLVVFKPEPIAAVRQNA